MAQQPNAILAISSTDRYIKSSGGNVNQPVSNFLLGEYNAGKPFSNDFQIESPNALINGYIEKIIISQIQLQYNVPTIIPGKNDLMVIEIESGEGTGVFYPYNINIPYGYYTPDDLATLVQALILELGTNILIDVTYNNGSEAGSISPVGFWFAGLNNIRFSFPFPDAVIYTLAPSQYETVLKTYRVFGINTFNQIPEIGQQSQVAPVFLYTPYIDIYSDALTNYQKLKDTDSSTSKRKGLLARIYLSAVGSPQFTFNGDALGCFPFVATYDLNSPKIIQWSQDTAVNSLDFQMRDCYGDLLFVSGSSAVVSVQEVFNTEWQMTLLCVEGK